MEVTVNAVQQEIGIVGLANLGLRGQQIAEGTVAAGLIKVTRCCAVVGVVVLTVGNLDGFQFFAFRRKALQGGELGGIAALCAVILHTGGLCLYAAGQFTVHDGADRQNVAVRMITCFEDTAIAEAGIFDGGSGIGDVDRHRGLLDLIPEIISFAQFRLSLQPSTVIDGAVSTQRAHRDRKVR